MPKREAEEYITKDKGSQVNTVEDNKVKMATAAQMAKRKMAAPKSRLNRSTTPTGMSAPNPFASSAPTGFGTTSTSQSQLFQPVGGVQFGATTQSQSFPPANQPVTGGFSFTAPGGSSSFTFGNNQEQSQSNPFAAINGTATQEPPKSSEDTMMESPQKKPTFGSGIFGSSTDNSNDSSSAIGVFGQPAQPQPLKFGQTLDNKANGGNTNLFAGFQSIGSNTLQPQTSNPFSSSLGAPSSNEKSTTPFNPVSKPLFKFGEPSGTASSQSSAPTFGGFESNNANTSQPSGFTFKQTPTGPSAQRDTIPATTPASPFKFGESASSSVPAFGNTTPAPAATGGTQAFVTSTTSMPLANPFANLATPKPVETPGLGQPSRQPQDNFFGSPEPGLSASSSTPNPFGSLFASGAKSEQKSQPAPSSESTKPVFSFAAPAQPSGLGSFGTSKTTQPESPSKSDEAFHSKTLFNFGASPAAPSFGSPAKPTSNDAKPNGLSNQLKEGAAIDADAGSFKPVDDSAKPTAKFLFGQTASSKSPALEPTAKRLFDFGTPQASTPSNMFGAGLPSDTIVDTPKEKPAVTPKPSISGPNSHSGVLSRPTFSESAPDPSPINPAHSLHSLSEATPGAEATGRPSPPKRTVYSNATARIPPYLDAEKYKSYDSNYRLHSLNREFQKRIAALNPSTQDFENIVRSYVAARESIGESIGLYIRNVAGSKRKDDDRDDDDNSSRTKKSRMADSTPSFGGKSQIHSQNDGSIFKPVPSSTTTTPSRSTDSALHLSAEPVTRGTQLTNGSTSISSQSHGTSINPFASLGTSSSSTNMPLAKASFALNGSTTSNSTTPPSSPPKQGAFKMPIFAGTTSGQNFFAEFGKKSEADAKRSARAEKEKRKAEEFDSDEEDEAAWEKKYDEEERKKRAKVDSIVQKGFTPSFGATSSAQKTSSFTFGGNTTGKPAESSGSGIDNVLNHLGATSSAESSDAVDSEVENADDDEEHNSADDEAGTEDTAEIEGADDDDDDDGDGEQMLASTKPAATSTTAPGRSLFDRITPSTSQNNTPPNEPSEAKAKPSLFKGTPETPSFSPFTPSTISKESYVPSKTFHFTPTPSAVPNSTPGASIFAGGSVNEGKIPGEGLFGSRPSTPVNGEVLKENPFASLTNATNSSSTSDHTWKRGSQIKFGESEAPAVNIIAASPAKDNPKPFANLFGQSTTPNTGGSSAAVGFGFGAGVPVVVPGFLGATSHLAPGSGPSSRATSPGLTDTESVATNDTDDVQIDPQTSLMDSRTGEENEEILFESRVRANKFRTSKQAQDEKKKEGWQPEGLGPLRILKDKGSGKVRVVMRADPGANVVINALISPHVTYKSAPSGKQATVSFPLPVTGGIENWSIKVKNIEIATEMVDVLEKNKPKS